MVVLNFFFILLRINYNVIASFIQLIRYYVQVISIYDLILAIILVNFWLNRFIWLFFHLNHRFFVLFYSSMNKWLTIFVMFKNLFDN